MRELPNRMARLRRDWHRCRPRRVHAHPTRSGCTALLAAVVLLRVPPPLPLCPRLTPGSVADRGVRTSRRLRLSVSQPRWRAVKSHLTRAPERTDRTLTDAASGAV